MGAISYDGLQRPISITNLMIPSYGVFDVTIHFDQSFDDIFGSGNPPAILPYFENDQPGGQAATTAIEDALNADGPVYPTTPQSESRVRVPIFSGTTSYDYHTTVLFDPRTAYSGADDSPSFWDRDSASQVIGIATFTEVPEPASLALGGLALVVAYSSRFLRRRL